MIYSTQIIILTLHSNLSDIGDAHNIGEYSRSCDTGTCSISFNHHGVFVVSLCGD